MHNAQTSLAAHIKVLSWRELNILLERFPIFTNMEPLASHMNELFPMTERIPMDVTVDPQHNFMACVSNGTTDETIEAIMCLKDYTIMKTMEVVWYLLHLMYMLYTLFFLTYSPWLFASNFSQGLKFDETTFSYLWTAEGSKKN